MEKIRVLFLCTGNSARSQMAEAFLRKHAGEQFEAYSAGLEPKEIHPYARQVLAEAGLDMAGQYSKSVNEYLGKVDFGYVITVCANAEKRCPFFPGRTLRLHWPFEDPAKFVGTEEEKLNKFSEVRDQIEEKIKTWVIEANPAAEQGLDFVLKLN
jgi:arsenate reductase (thioredoxin)